MLDRCRNMPAPSLSFFAPNPDVGVGEGLSNFCDFGILRGSGTLRVSETLSVFRGEWDVRPDAFFAEAFFGKFLHAQLSHFKDELSKAHVGALRAQQRTHL